MKRILLPITVLLAGAAYGQTHSGPWSLAECIRHAQENNITLQQQSLQVKQQEIQLDNAKGNRLPQVSASASENFSFGRGLTADNTYSNTNTTSTGLPSVRQCLYSRVAGSATASRRAN